MKPKPQARRALFELVAAGDGETLERRAVVERAVGGRRIAAASSQCSEWCDRGAAKHVEHGINVPGSRIVEARQALEGKTQADRKRVAGAMLASALFNRAADILTKLVELQTFGIEIRSDNPLMRECGACLQEALGLGKLVRHRSGEEGLDELWGEPFKAFVFPIETFYQSRYLKAAAAMTAIDTVAAGLVETFAGIPAFSALREEAQFFANAAKNKCETICTEPDIFDVWTTFVVAEERLDAFEPRLACSAPEPEREWALGGSRLIQDARSVIFHITRARVPMPRTARELLDRCERHRASCPGKALTHRHVA